MWNKLGNYLDSLAKNNHLSIWKKILVKLLKIYRHSKTFFKKTDYKILSKSYIRLRSYKRALTSQKTTFVTLDELMLWTREFIRLFPESYDLIIGIPRSGLLVANIIALKLGKPLTTPDIILENKKWKSKLIPNYEKIKNVLLIDDSVCSGGSLKKNYDLICSTFKNVNITKAALIVTPEGSQLVDLYFKIIANPRIFEWNLMHFKNRIVAVDMDGVLCENCPGVDGDEELYEKWIRNAKPYLIPAFELEAIVTNRLEQYRTLTETWLKKHNVKYKKLLMWDIPSKNLRKQGHAKNKAQWLYRIKPDIFLESSLKESEEIWKMTKIPCLCIDEMVLFE